MIDVGASVPEASVWTAPNRRRTLADLFSDGRALILFYLFDWSST
ncbi:MAG: hypothetical protein ACJ74L_06085 [Gaiellaceae bacterium]|jgi:hypothetical protein